MKALEILRKHRAELATYKNAGEIVSEFDEAIAELEALLEHKSCNGCEYDVGFVYETCNYCVRQKIDYYKPKDSQ